MDTTYCPHCWPIKRTSHTPMLVSYYMRKSGDFFLAPFRALSRMSKHKKIYRNPNRPWNTLLEALSYIGAARYEANPGEDDLHPRSSMFFNEAKRRGIDIRAGKLFGGYSNDFKFIWKGKTYYYETIPMTMWENDFFMDSKIDAKRLLSEHGVPVAEGQIFTDTKKAFEYGKALGYELVVKPNNGSLSNHVTCYIKTDDELRRAIELAHAYSPEFIVERAIPGNVYRATVVGNKHVFVSERDRANVVGDGGHTVQELLNLKNADEKRAAAFTTNASVHQVPVDQITLDHLASMGQSMEYVPAKGEKVYLYSNKKYVPDRGNDIINRTAVTHPENIEHFLKVAAILKTGLVGMDFICADITKPYHEQQSAVLETNSLPFIDMHEFPSHGEGDPVSRLTWDVVLEKLDAQDK